MNHVMPFTTEYVARLVMYLNLPFNSFPAAQIGHKNRLDEKKSFTAEEVVAIVKEIFVIATERDIYTGDSVEIKVIRKSGISTEVFPLKHD